MTFHHVGVAVRSIERALECYEGLFGFERVGAYHICYEVDNLDESIRALRKARCVPFRKFDSGLPDGRRFAFLLNPDRQLFELCESGAGEMSSAVSR